MNDLEDYMRIYLKTDVNLLACVFEEFRNVCMKQYNLDPAHFKEHQVHHEVHALKRQK